MYKEYQTGLKMKNTEFLSTAVDAVWAAALALNKTLPQPLEQFSYSHKKMAQSVYSNLKKVQFKGSSVRIMCYLSLHRVFTLSQVRFGDHLVFILLLSLKCTTLLNEWVMVLPQIAA